MVGSRLTVPHIRFYISDYGFGHASRMIALMRSLHETIDCIISVRTNTAAGFIQNSCPFVKIDEKPNDIGVVMQENTASVDVEQTRVKLDAWVDSWDAWIQEETKYCKSQNVSLVISDITPQAFHVSNELGIPGIGISNFTWHLIYHPLYQDSKSVEKIRLAYNLADLGIVLPLNEPMGVFRETYQSPILSRKITVSRDEIRKRLQIPKDGIVVYVGSGLSFNTVPDCIPKLLEKGILVVVSGGCSINHENLHIIPYSENETQNFMGACDLVVTKPGYSTVAEAITTKVPLLIFRREGFAEDDFIINPLVENRIGMSLSWEEIAEGNWIENISEILSMKENYLQANSKFITDGTQAIITKLKEYL